MTEKWFRSPLRAYRWLLGLVSLLFLGAMTVGFVQNGAGLSFEFGMLIVFPATTLLVLAPFYYGFVASDQDLGRAVERVQRLFA